MWISFVVILSIYRHSINGLQLPEETFAWNELTFNWTDQEIRDNAINSGDYIPVHNLPLGLERWKDKLFVTVPRWKSGVAATLNYISLSNGNKSASLTPYPDWKTNTLPKDKIASYDDPLLVSVFRVKADPCNRLWVMDTGLADILGDAKQYTKPNIQIFDLNTDRLLKKYELKENDMKDNSFFANIIVDVSPDQCEKAYAYIPDLGGYGLVVFSLADNDSWRINHNYFHFDPLKGNFNVGGINFQWTDGIFSVALSKPKPNGSRIAYFHALASTCEFSVPTDILKNKTASDEPNFYYKFKMEGNRGDLTQSSASDIDQATDVLFLTQVNRNGVACWNPKKPLNSQNLVLVLEDKSKLIFPNDIKIDSERNLWVLSDKMPQYLFQKLNKNEINYRIYKINIDDLLKGTSCQA